MSERDHGGIWLAAYAIALAFCALVAITQFGCGCRPPRHQAAEPAPRTITVTLRCLAQEPPKPLPSTATDAQLAQAYEALRRWVWLYAWPSCRE